MNPGRIEIVEQPAVEPVTLDEAKKHLRLDIDDDDDYVQECIEAARRVCEVMMERCFITTTLDHYFDSMPAGGGYWNREIRNQGPDPDNPNWLPTWNAPLRLMRAPLIEVVSLTYLDMSGQPASMDVADIRAIPGTPPRIQPVYGKIWPWVLPVNDVVVVRYKAGYGDDPSSVPATIKRAIKLLVGTYYENRESVGVGSIGSIPDGFERLLGIEGWGADYS